MPANGLDLNQWLLELAAKNPELVQKDYERSYDLIIEKQLMFRKDKGGFHTPIPYCIPESRYVSLCSNAELVFRALEKVVKGYRTDARIRAFFPHLQKFETFLSLPVLSDPQITIARFDIMETPSGEFKVIEPNTCCPGGAYRTSLYYDAFQQTQIFREITKQAQIVPVPLHSGRMIYDYLTSEYEKYFQPEERYHLVIGESTSQVSVRSVLEHKRNGAIRYGCDSDIAVIQELTFDGKDLLLRGKKVHILYQFLDVLFKNDLANIAANYDEIKDYLEAARHKAFLMVNPFPPIFISEDKSILALVREPELQDLFDADERRAIEALVPETYRLRDTVVSFEGSQVPLEKLLLQRKDDFVIKAQMESMGRDVMIGREATPAQWEEKIRSSWAGPYIAQEMVETRPVEMINPAKLTEKARMNYTLALFVIGGKTKGMFNRVSPGFITNVAQGGARQDVIVYRDK